MNRIAFAVCLPFLLLAGCSPWVAGYYYQPHPGVSEIPATQPSQPPAVSAFGTVIGIREPDSHQNLPYAVEVRLRLDNHGPDMVTFEQKSMELTTGDLVRFPPPLASAPAPLTIEPGQSVVVTADFPFPPAPTFDEINLDTLQLRWLSKVGDRNVQQSIDFHRSDYHYYNGYDDYGPGYGPYYGAAYYPYPVFRGAVIIRR